ncbi:MAG: DUF433 domain-containing protein [Elusimicrobia bacterium]|nr:DUF433 domain-containing protein [Elusimicrobiota bacterium]
MSVDPEVCHGKPCFRGTRFMVATALEFDGRSLAATDHELGAERRDDEGAFVHRDFHVAAREAGETVRGNGDLLSIEPPSGTFNAPRLAAGSTSPTFP